MKKIILTFLVGLLVMSSLPAAYAQNPPQDYAKYGRIATAVVKEDYPGEELVEYEYVGRDKKSDQEVTDTFRFEVLENGKPKFVNVKVTHNLQNNRLLTLTVTEE